LQNNKIVNIFSIDGFFNSNPTKWFYKLIGTVLTKFSTEIDTEASSSVYSSQLLSDGSFALGTVSDGIFILSNSGKIKYHYTKQRIEQ
jgi:hypothetical protein